MANNIDFNIQINGGGASELRRVSEEAHDAGRAIDEIGRSASNATSGLRKMADESIGLSSCMSALNSLKGMVSDMVAPYNSFETSMARANTMAGTSGGEFDNLTDKIKSMSREIPMLREELANGLYETISNGVPKDNWISYLEASAKASKGGCADLGQTVSVTATLIKNYGESWDKAGTIQDKMQVTAKNGKTCIAELGQALPRVSGSAAQLGVQMDELMAVFATTTGVTGNTSEVSTQFAAVLNSLIKPSSEATKAADAMGIKFDAASVKACGGFKNFLTQLDASVKSYAQSSGQLSETIYGQLFGSAEALRLLGSLTGEQKDTFTNNIAAMADSTGAIDEAFNQMTDTGESTTQKFKNYFASVTDALAGAFGWSAPFIEMAANAGIAALGIAQLAVFVKGLGLASKMAAVGHWMQVAAIKGLGIASKVAAVGHWMVIAATKAWTIAQYALNVALSANPIGLIVMAIAALVAGIIYAYNNCEEFREICDKVWAVVKEVAKAVWDFLVAAFDKVSEVVKAAWGWLKEFFGIADDSSAEDVAEGLTALAEAGGKVAETNKKVAETGLAAAEAVDWQKMSYEQLGKEIDRQKTKVAQLAGTNAANAKAEADKLKKMEQRYKALGKQYNLSNDSSSNEFSGKTLIANAQSYKELGNNITYYQNRLEKLKPTETDEIRRLSQTVAVLKKKQEAIKQLQASYTRPTSLDTKDDYDAEIAYQESKLGTATRSEAMAINAVIEKLKEEREAFDKVAHVPVGVDRITTYQELQKEISYYNDILQSGNAAERVFAQSNLNTLNELKDKWDNMLAELDSPMGVESCESIAELEKAIGILDAKIKRAGVNEAAVLAQTKTAYEQKLATLKSSLNIPELAAAAARINTLTGSEHKVAVKGIGFDELKKRIAELQELLANKDIDLGEGQRQQIESLIKVYKKWQRESVDAFGSVRQGWEGIKGATNGIKGMSDALRGNGTAWEKATAVIDGALAVYDSFNKLAQVARMVTQALGLAKLTEAASTGAATVATEAGAAASVAAGAQEVAASGAVTTAKVAEAGAKTLAAHAGIPWVGIAIAGGMIAAMTAMMFALPKFADGGIAYGPTLGLFGEYAGASNNPEVVAPLSKLRGLLAEGGAGGGGGQVVFEIEGRKLKGVLQKVDQFDSRTR